MQLINVTPTFTPALEAVAAQALTMSSLDFLDSIINPARVGAGELEIEPRKFLAKIEDELDIDVTGKKFRINNNQTQSAYYDLDFDQMMLVGMRESKAVRRAVLAKLKVMQAPQIPQTLPEALRLAADLAEEQQKLKQELAAAAPKVEFVDRYCTANGSMTFRQVAKLLKAKETELRLFLLEQHIMYRLNNVMTPHAHHLDAGRFEVKTGTTASSNYAFSQARFTAKGVQWIGGLWTAYKAKGEDNA